MARRKNSPSAPDEQSAKQILDNYDFKNAQDVQEVIKQSFGSIFESMLKGDHRWQDLDLAIEREDVREKLYREYHME